jgi:uncharacterized protein (DUF427 family)
MTEVRLEQAKRVHVRLGGADIVDTARGYVVYEGTLPPRYYVPREDVKAELTKGQGAASCPWKGKWEHLDATVGGKRVANAAWTYFEPTTVCEPIRNFVAFYPDKVELLETS